MAAKKNPKSVNKSEYIRKHPNLKAGDLVSKAKAEGIAITAGLVYAVRSAGKAKPAGQQVRAVRGAQTSPSRGSLDDMVREIVRQEIREFFNR